MRNATAHVITIDKLYNNQNSEEDISDHEESFDDNCDLGLNTHHQNPPNYFGCER